MSREVCVVDASVGVKWFRKESGSDEAAALLEKHVLGRAVIAVNSLFYYEVLNAASRQGGIDGRQLWVDLTRLELASVPLDDKTVSAALNAKSSLNCSLYDAFAAGLADLLEAPLYSADARAHRAHPRVRLIG